MNKQKFISALNAKDAQIRVSVVSLKCLSCFISFTEIDVLLSIGNLGHLFCWLGKNSLRPR